MAFVRAQRLEILPPYLFANIDRLKRQVAAAGHDVIDFGVGDPDLPTPRFIIEKLQQAATHPPYHRYALDEGCPEYRTAIAKWFSRRFNVTLDPQREIIMLIGSKEGLGHLPLACINPGDVSLIPTPGYPVYCSATLFAGGQPYEMPLRSESGFLPDLSAIPDEIRRRAKMLFINYPNNPTGATADLAFYQRVVAFAQAHDLIVVSDAAYSEVAFEMRPPSILQVEGAKSCAVELHSLSKTFNMTGWRIGFAVGNPDVLAALGKIKANMDSGQFTAIQIAAATALDHSDHVEVQAMIDIYRERRDLLVEGLQRLGWAATKSPATFYVWVPIPKNYDSMSFASLLLEQAHVVVIPGSGFGPAGEGYIRFALTIPQDRIRLALERIARLAV
ncbi:MAG: LL-diaminopimelate aminotransferase [Phycisphaerae bacterium]|nr:LL-diaminopimelate aminotransferase [Phycisphaerae bacterium]